ncbi:MAG: 1-acyl-sn-glycerol-3-phosphate acyltransferase [Ilumatobacteraceae bacterium]
MRMPPRWTRRLLLWPLPVIAVLIVLATVPLLALVALVLSFRLPGKLRLLRSLGLLIVYLLLEATTMVLGLGLWIASGFGWKLRSPGFVAIHYRLLRWVVAVLIGAGKRLFSLSLETDGTPVPDDDGNGRRVPLIVMSRHAGPADSILLIHEVLSWQGRRPRIVSRAAIQFDPACDLLLNRLPNRFISSNPEHPDATTEAIAELAGSMGDDDAFVIFPEGGNFTPARRQRAIDRLSASGHDEAAARAREMHNVMPPRPRGVAAALRACPRADAVFVAHTGLDTIATIADLWDCIPIHKVVQMNWHVVEASTVPRDDDGINDMLYQAWEAIDTWIIDQSDDAVAAS